MTDKQFKGWLKSNRCISEMRWILTGELCIWVYLYDLVEFIDEVKEIFGTYSFDEGGFDIRLLEDCVCINVEDLFGGYLDKPLIEIFPKEEFE